MREEKRYHPLAVVREHHNLTQKRLAEVVRIGERTVTRAENNKPISAESRRRLCEYFGMTAEQLGLKGESGDSTEPQITKEEEGQTDPNRECIPIIAQAGKESELSFEPTPVSLDLEGIPPLLPHDAQGMMRGASKELEEQSMDEVRRQLMQQALSATGTAMIAPAFLLEQFARVLARSSTIDETTFKYLETRTACYWRDRHGAIVASSVLRDYALEHLQKILTFLEWSLLPSERRRLCALASGTAQLIGHLFFDLSDYSNARNFHKKAIQAAQEADDTALEAVAWGRMSFTWTYSGNAQKALPCIQQAHSLAIGKTSQVVQAYLWAVEAEIQAILHDREASLNALGEAECINKQSENAEDHYWLRFDHSRLEGYQGSCFRHFYHLEAPKTVAFLTQAQKALKDALAHLSPSMMQRRPALLIDLASTYTLQREFEEACEYAIQAIIILAQIKSRTGMQRLLTLRQDLAPWRDTSYVKKVDEYIEALLVPEWRRSV